MTDPTPTTIDRPSKKAFVPIAHGTHRYGGTPPGLVKGAS